MAFRPTVEVPMFLTFVAFFLCESVNTNLLIFRTCYVTLGQDYHNCSLLGSKVKNEITIALEKLVQPKADIIAMTKTLVDSLSAALLCLFVGPWSDRFGRKPILVMNLIGYTLMNAVMVVYSVIPSASPWYMMTCSVPVILTGGGATLLTVFLAYLTDISSENDRGFRMGIFEIVMAIAVFAGSLSSSYVFNATSYMVVFSIATALCFSALLFTIFFIPESLQNREDTGRVKGFFQLRNLSGMLRTSFKPRQGFNRSIILLIVTALALYFVVKFGDASVMFLFVREKFSWDLQQYTWYNSADNVMWITSTFFVVYLLHHKLRVTEARLMLAGFVALAVGALVLALARVDWLIYFAAAVRMPSGGLTPMTRSLMSKLVDADEAGKIFALFTLVQNVLGLVGSPIYTLLYNATINANPAAFNFLSSAVYALNGCLILVVLLLQRRAYDVAYSSLSADNGPEENDSENTAQT